MDDPLHCECNHLQKMFELFLVEMDTLPEPRREDVFRDIINVCSA